MACVADALRQSNALPADQYDVFASIGGSEPKVTFADGKLTPAHEKARECFHTSANGKTEITLSDYGAFVVVAAGLPAVRAEFPHPFKNVVLSSLNGRAHVPDYDLAERTYVSSACAE